MRVCCLYKAKVGSRRTKKTSAINRVREAVSVGGVSCMNGVEHLYGGPQPPADSACAI